MYYFASYYFSGYYFASYASGGGSGNRPDQYSNLGPRMGLRG